MSVIETRIIQYPCIIPIGQLNKGYLAYVEAVVAFSNTACINIIVFS